MRFRNFMAPAIGLVFAGVAAAQTPTTPQPATPRSDPNTPQPASTPYQPASQTPITQQPQQQQQQQPSSTSQQSQGMNEQQQEPGMRHGPEMAMVQSHLDTVLQGVSLSYAQYRRIDSTAMRQVASAGFRRGDRMGMGRRDGMGRDGRSNNTNCGVNSQPSTTPGSTNSNCPPNQSGTPTSPQRDSSSTSSGYPQSGQQPGSASSPTTPNTGANNQWNDRRGGMNDTLSASDRSRLMPVLDQIDTAIRPILIAAQQRTFDRNVSTWKRNHATSTN